ncbi:hypothetical protein J6590_062891 [Homalodisca vitripennis]|nr:hypothetical protein J6590_062891 [Homalodisca vitripennis]
MLKPGFRRSRRTINFQQISFDNSPPLCGPRHKHGKVNDCNRRGYFALSCWSRHFLLQQSSTTRISPVSATGTAVTGVYESVEEDEDNV